MVMVPATVSNNIPGSDLSIGADTALNAITDVSVAGECGNVSFIHTQTTHPVKSGGFADWCSSPDITHAEHMHSFQFSTRVDSYD